VIEPVEHGGKANEAVEGDCEFFVARRDAAVALDPAEEVFDHMAVPVKLAVEVDWRAPATAGWDAGECAGTGEISAEAGGIEAAVRDRPAPVQARLKRCAGTKIVLLSWREMQTNGSSDTVHHGCELGVEPALGAAHGLIRLSADRVRGVSVHLDVRAIDAPDLSGRPTSDGLEQPRPQARRTPSSESGVNRTPWTKAGWQITPWDSGPQDIPDARDHESIALRGPAATVTIVTFSRVPPSVRFRSIFLAAPKAARLTRNDLMDS
jgi:hypothetical protein